MATTGSTTSCSTPPSRAWLPCWTGSCPPWAIPLADFSYHCMAWHIPPGWAAASAGWTCGAGHSRRRQLHPPYCERTGLTTPEALRADWNFYMAYNMFRIAAILQGIAKRVEAGTASSAQAKASGAGAPHGPAGLVVRPAQLNPRSYFFDGDPPWTLTTPPRPRNCRPSCSSSWTTTSTRPRQPTPRAGRQHGRRQALDAAADHRKPQAQGPGRRAVEPVPAGGHAEASGYHGARPDQPGIRAPGRNHGPRALGQRGLQLLGARHRQHGNHRPLRQTRKTRPAGSSRCSRARSARPSP
jgi:hypothetical protein